MIYTRLQIVRLLKQGGWQKKRTLWYAPKRFSKHFQTLGIDLRAAASLEGLASSENLDTRRAK
jgi:hypothetical protein